MSKKTTFKELIGEISDRTQKSQTFSEHFIRELVSIIEAGLESEGSVTLAGFGKFELRWMNERSGVNPQTGEEITIPGQNKVVFKPYKPLREHVNKPYSQMRSQLLDTSPSTSAGPDGQTGDDSENGEKDEDFSSQKESVRDDPFQLEKEINEEDDIDNWVYERPSPVQSRSKQTGQANKVDSRNSLAVKMDQSEPSGQNRNRNREGFRWSYAALAGILLIAFLALFIVLKPGQDINEPLPEQPAAVTEPESPAVGEAEQQEPAGEAPENDTGFIPVEVEAGQSLWGLAETHLENAYLWPWIYHVNRTQLSNPDLIIAGNELTLPVPANKDRLKEDERMGVANGYLDIYSWYRDTDPANAKYFLWAAGTFNEEVLDQAEGSVNYNDLVFARSR
ncbi:MAG: HU family DNA-binding protein [Balneolaceae bacterium]